MKILVTGGAGFIGSHTCVELISAGYEIVVIDNYSNSKPECVNRVKQITNSEFPVYENDVLDAPALRTLFSEHEIHAVIHFAGLKAVGESVSKPLLYYQNNIAGTLTLCGVMREFNVNNIVFSSSATVYGSKHPIPYIEDMETGGCTSPYAQTKFMIELILKDINNADKNFNVSILRYFNPIGAHESGLIGEDPNGIPNNLMPYITQVAVGKLPRLSVFGGDYDTEDGTGVRDYIHVTDLARGHVKALKYLERHNGCFVHNLGTGKGTSVLRLVQAFERANGVKIPYSIVGRRDGDIAAYYADAAKAKAELGFETEYNIERMCVDSYRWQMNNPKGF